MSPKPAPSIGAVWVWARSAKRYPPPFYRQCFGFRVLPPEQLPALEAVVLDGYIEGLRQAGWQGDPELVRLGYLCSVALRYGPNIVFPEILAMDPKVAEGMQQRFGHSIDEWADRLLLIRRFVIQRADQARQLMA